MNFGIGIAAASSGKKTKKGFHALFIRFKEAKVQRSVSLHLKPDRESSAK